MTSNVGCKIKVANAFSLTENAIKIFVWGHLFTETTASMYKKISAEFAFSTLFKLDSDTKGAYGIFPSLRCKIWRPCYGHISFRNNSIEKIE